MTCRTRKLRPLVKIHGGKHYAARRIIARLPEHRAYLEPYLGGASVLLNKPRSEIEVANDLDAGLMRIYAALRDRTEEFVARLGALSYSSETWERTAIGEPSDDLDRAVRSLVRRRMSRGGLGKDFAWSDRLRGGRPGDLNAWLTFLEALPEIARRLARVVFRNRDARSVIREFDAPDSLIYADPPYAHEARTARSIYEHEMSEGDHADLLECLRACRGAVVLSGYSTSLYERALKGWARFEFDMPNHAGQGRTKQRRTEVLWIKGRGRR